MKIEGLRNLLFDNNNKRDNYSIFDQVQSAYNID